MSRFYTSVAMEIFTNPSDLGISIDQDARTGKYVMSIKRGPGDFFKTILTSPPVDKVEDGIEAARKLLEGIYRVFTCPNEGGKSLLDLYFKKQSSGADVLSSELIMQILDELRRHQMATTYPNVES